MLKKDSLSKATMVYEFHDTNNQMNDLYIYQKQMCEL